MFLDQKFLLKKINKKNFRLNSSNCKKNLKKNNEGTTKLRKMVLNEKLHLERSEKNFEQRALRKVFKK